MAQVRDIISHVDVEYATNRRKCHHSRGKHAISGGQACLAITDHMGGRKNYCRECALEIIQKAEAKLATLCDQLKGQTSSLE